MVALCLALPAQSALARDPDMLPSPHHEAARIMSSEQAMAQAKAQLKTLSAQTPPTAPADRIRYDLAVAAAAYAYRNAARGEELRVYELAGYASVEASVLPLLPASLARSMRAAIAGLHSLYILAGIDQYYLVNVHFTHPYSDAKSVDLLRSYYQEAFTQFGVDPNILAAINFIESNFGRVNGPSSAGALGPMQFLPGTWAAYGEGGDVNDPHDAILGAARYLVHNGAPGDMRNAIWHYNNSFDYVDSVQSFASAFRSDPAWLDRMYYWNTTG
ncbi:MAG TPA: transglycosylase SLT domain-containing protein [Candidatus Dormibacteraeota bacterium]|nr:transglycosylase SLT domain-containing protein [Candidatus Dormibacteraeota bacterium]